MNDSGVNVGGQFANCPRKSKKTMGVSYVVSQDRATAGAAVRRIMGFPHDSAIAVTDGFEPRNELEQCLADAQAGLVEGEAFMVKLLESQVFMPIQEGGGGDGRVIGNIQLDREARPLVVEADDGGRFLVLFTSPERAGVFVKNHPGYETGGLLAEFSWVLEKIGVDCGVTINPGWPVGVELEAEAVRRFGGLRH